MPKLPPEWNSLLPRKWRRKTDTELLDDILLEVILDFYDKHDRAPTKKEILDRLFSRRRSDYEAKELEKKLTRTIERLL